IAFPIWSSYREQQDTRCLLRGVMETKEVGTRTALAVAPGVWPVAWTAIVGGLGVLFASTTVAVAIEPLAGILGVPLSTMQWISTGYLLALAVVVPIVPWAQRAEERRGGGGGRARV